MEITEYTGAVDTQNMAAKVADELTNQMAALKDISAALQAADAFMMQHESVLPVMSTDLGPSVYDALGAIGDKYEEPSDARFAERLRGALDNQASLTDMRDIVNNQYDNIRSVEQEHAFELGARDDYLALTKQPAEPHNVEHTTETLSSAIVAAAMTDTLEMNGAAVTKQMGERLNEEIESGNASHAYQNIAETLNCLQQDGMSRSQQVQDTITGMKALCELCHERGFTLEDTSKIEETGAAMRTAINDMVAITRDPAADASADRARDASGDIGI